MKNPLKRRKFDKIIKKDIKVKVWDNDPEVFEICYLYMVRSKHIQTSHAFRVWNSGKTAEQLKFKSFNTTPYKHAELIEEEKKTNISAKVTLVPGSLSMQYSNDGGKTFQSFDTVPISWKPTIPEVQEFCDKYGVWCAMDETGEWFWYTKKPEIVGDWWCMDGSPYENDRSLPFQSAFKGDWKDTLHEPRGKE
jgi:hypothetical protein